MVENGVKLRFSYILPDSSVGFEHLEPTGGAISMIEMGMSNFKQFSIESYLQIPEVKPDVESINIATGTIDMLSQLQSIALWKTKELLVTN